MEVAESLSEIQRAITERRYNVEDVVDKYLSNIKAHSNLNAFVHVFSEDAKAKARALDQRIKEGQKVGKMFGAIISVKDNICIEGKPVSAASTILKGYISPYSASAIERLIDEDAIVIGTTNCDEFGMGSTSTNSCYGPVKNGYDHQLIAGGSSGGAAVSVQMDCCIAALGSDTGGSIRQPAAICNVIGYKPTYGRISRYGLIAYASSFDQIGIISKELALVDLMLRIMEGRDEYDSTVCDSFEGDFIAKEKLKIGVINEMFDSNNDFTSEVRKAITSLEGAHKINELRFDFMKYLVPCYYILTTAEASSNLSRYDGVRYGYRSSNAKNLEALYTMSRTEGFGKEVKKRIMLGTFVLSEGYFDAFYVKAQKVRRMITEQFEQLFEENDVIAMPVTSSPAWSLNHQPSDALEIYYSDIYTVLANITGLPAISIPFNFDQKVVNIQFIGKRNHDHELIKNIENIIERSKIHQ